MAILSVDAAASSPAVARVAPARPLGAFRLVLALMVVGQHFQHLLPASDRVAFHRMGLGAVAVAVFFAVSGFVVTEANAVFYAGRPDAFLANRLLRVVPPYVAALAVSVFVHAALWRAGRLVLWDYTLVGSPLDWRLLAGGVAALVPGFHTRLLAQDFEFIPFVWSLRVEMAFYAATWLVLRVARGERRRPVIAAALCIGLLASLAFLRAGQPGLLSTLPMFLAGVAVRLLGEATPARVFYAVVTVIAAGIGFASWDQHGYPVLAWQLTLLGALFTGFAWLARCRTPGWLRAADRALGDLSYPLYLNHYAVGILVTSLVPEGNGLAYAAGIAMSAALAFAMARAVEMPLRVARDRIRRVVL